MAVLAYRRNLQKKPQAIPASLHPAEFLSVKIVELYKCLGIERLDSYFSS